MFNLVIERKWRPDNPVCLSPWNALAERDCSASPPAMRLLRICHGDGKTTLRRLGGRSVLSLFRNGPHSMAEIAVHPSVKFRYASNRGHNSLVGYRIDPSTGLLSVIGFATQGVNFLRKFVIDPESEVAIRRQPEGRHHRAVRD